MSFESKRPTPRTLISLGLVGALTLTLFLVRREKGDPHVSPSSAVPAQHPPATVPPVAGLVGSPKTVTPETDGDSAEKSIGAIPSQDLQPPSLTHTDCFTLSFRHTEIASHADGEACALHKNLLTLKHLKLNARSLCVRVDGKPVRHESVKKHPDQIMLGAVAGPKSIVTVRYCLKSNHCSDDCKIAKDSFLSALAGVDAQETSEENVEEFKGLDAEVKKELEKLDENGVAKQAIFAAWKSESQVAGCQAPAKL